MSEMMGSLEELALVTVHRGAGPVKIWVSGRGGGVWEGGRPGYGGAFINQASSHLPSSSRREGRDGSVGGLREGDEDPDFRARLCWDDSDHSWQ